MAWGDTWDKVIKPMQEAKQQLIVGVDIGAGDDKTVVGMVKDGKLNIIGENIELIIPTGSWKSKTVSVIQIGDLAVYMGDEDDIQVIIHVPTLSGFDKALPEGDWTQEQLIQWCWKVQQATDPNWTALREFNNDNYNTVPQYLLDSVKAYCLSISPGDI